MEAKEEVIASREINWRPVFISGGIAAILQILIVVGYLFIMPLMDIQSVDTERLMAMGAAKIFFQVHFFDFISMLIVVMYAFTSLAISAGLRKRDLPLAIMALVMVAVAIAMTVATESTLSLIYLSDIYAAADSPLARQQAVAAAEGVLASNMWHSSAGLMAGIFLQGGGVILSLLMLSSPRFFWITAWSGLLANGLDLIQHLLHFFLPGIAEIILMTSGAFYLVWFIALAWDLLRKPGTNPYEPSPAAAA